MIVVDPLFDTTPFTRKGTPRCFRNTLTSHMMTTLEGEAGRLDVLAARRRSPERSPIVRPNTPEPEEPVQLQAPARTVALGRFDGLDEGEEI